MSPAARPAGGESTGSAALNAASNVVAELKIRTRTSCWKALRMEGPLATSTRRDTMWTRQTLYRACRLALVGRSRLVVKQVDVQAIRKGQLISMRHYSASDNAADSEQRPMWRP